MKPLVDRMAPTLRVRRELAVLLGLSVCVLIAAAAAGRFDFTVSTRPVATSDRSCAPQPSRFETVPCQMAGTWQPTADGWQLRPGESGEIVARLDFQPTRHLLSVTPRASGPGAPRLQAALYGEGSPSTRTHILLSFDGLSYTEVAQDVAWDGSKVELIPSLDGIGAVWVKVIVRHDGHARMAHPAVLSRARFVTLATPAIVPNLASACFLLLVPLVAYRVRMATGPEQALRVAVGMLAAQVLLLESIARTWTQEADPIRWWELVTDGGERDLYLAMPYLVLLGLLAWLQWTGRVEDGQWLSLRHCTVLGILVWAMSRRFVALAQVMDMKLEPDVVGYMSIASQLTGPYETQFREPLWIWLTRGWLDLVGWGALEMRLLSVGASLVLLLAAYKFFTDYTGRWIIGAGVAWLLSVNPYVIRLSTRGLREEVFAIAVLALAYVVFVRPPTLSFRAQVAGLALSGAAMQLLRFNSSPVLVALLAYWAWRQAPGLRRWALVPLAFIAAVSVPHAVHNARVYDDPLHSVNVHFSWLRNYEFVIKKGQSCEGCPDRSQFFATPYAGPHVTAMDYVFKLHSLDEVVRDTLEGYRRMYLTRTDWFRVQSSTESNVGYVLFLIGLGVLCWGRYRELLGLIVLLANLLPFLMLRDADIRLAVGTIPFVTFIVVYGCWWCAERVVDLALAAGPGGTLNERIRLASARLAARNLPGAG